MAERTLEEEMALFESGDADWLKDAKRMFSQNVGTEYMKELKRSALLESALEWANLEFFNCGRDWKETSRNVVAKLKAERNFDSPLGGYLGREEAENERIQLEIAAGKPTDVVKSNTRYPREWFGDKGKSVITDATYIDALKYAHENCYVSNIRICDVPTPVHLFHLNLAWNDHKKHVDQYSKYIAPEDNSKKMMAGADSIVTLANDLLKKGPPTKLNETAEQFAAMKAEKAKEKKA